MLSKKLVKKILFIKIIPKDRQMDGNVDLIGKELEANRAILDAGWPC